MTYDIYVNRNGSPVRTHIGVTLALAAHHAQLDEHDVLASIESEFWCGARADEPLVITEHGEQLNRSAAHFLTENDQ